MFRQHMFTHFDFGQGNLNGKSVTSKYFQVIGNIHDIKSYSNTDNSLSLKVQIFTCHWVHLAIIHLWLGVIKFKQVIYFI